MFCIPFICFSSIPPKVMKFWSGWPKRANPIPSEVIFGHFEYKAIHIFNIYHWPRFVRKYRFWQFVESDTSPCLIKVDLCSRVDSRFPLVHAPPRNSSKSKIRRCQFWKISKYRDNIIYVKNFSWFPGWCKKEVKVLEEESL